MLVRHVDTRFSSTNLTYAFRHKYYYVLMFETHLTKHLKYNTSLGSYLITEVIWSEKKLRKVGKCYHCYSIGYSLEPGSLIRQLQVIDDQFANKLFRSFLSENLTRELREGYLDDSQDSDSDSMPELID